MRSGCRTGRIFFHWEENKCQTKSPTKRKAYPSVLIEASIHEYGELERVHRCGQEGRRHRRGGQGKEGHYDEYRSVEDSSGAKEPS